MLENSYQCPYCKKNLKAREIPEKTKIYYDGATHLSNAIELYNKGWECPDCGCRWYYNGKVFKDGKEELKDKYKVKKIEVVEEISTEQQSDNKENTKNNSKIENQEKSEDKKDEPTTTSK